ncbi:EAL domain-containing protein [Dactylosporangium sp. CS-047395]|uniref:EAL domain-containing protein n=1 Tax=Dactylosporangium sp. CS-047395 TaxID=3239936 RepID=UPI003D8B9C31
MSSLPPETPADKPQKALPIPCPLVDNDRVTTFAAAWERSLSRANFVPGGRARRTQILHTLTQNLLNALTSPADHPQAGFEVGSDLVRNALSDPQVLGASMRILRLRLLAELRIDSAAATARLAALIEQLALGFTTTLRDHARRAAEDVNRDEREAWRAHQMQLQHQVRHALLHDALTSLPNRAALTAYLDVVISEKPSTRIGVCLLNIRQFGAINHTHGTATADRILQLAAQRLHGLATERDYYLAHLGGDTFALVAEDTAGPDDAIKAADSALRMLHHQYWPTGNQLSITARAGVVERPIDLSTASDLLRAAALALAWTRQDNPTTSWTLFDQAREAQDMRRHQLTNALPLALSRGDFTLGYQPIIRLRDNTIIGMHALPRWSHPDLGTVPAGEFLALAEQLGLLVPLSTHLLQTACSRAKTWQSAPEPPMLTFDCPLSQLRDRNVVTTIVAALDTTALPPSRLQLAVAQDALHDLSDATAFTLDGLARTGIQIAVNNTGGPAHLAESPVSTVILDQRLTDALDLARPAYASSATTLAWLIEMFHDLARTVTAAHVNNRDQLHALSDLGCDTARGNYLAHPMTPEAADRLFNPKNPPPRTPAPETFK